MPRKVVEVLAVLAIWRGTPAAQEEIETVIQNTSDDPELAGAILSVIREPLGYAAKGERTERGDEARRRAFAITEKLLSASLAAYRARTDGIDLSTLSDVERARLQHLVRIIDGVARELYFASGAHSSSDDAPRRVDPAQGRRFYESAAPLIELLIPAGLVPAAHSILETLETLIDIEPANVFRHIHALLRAAHTRGYTGESMAINQIVRIVERYMADYRHLFQQDADLRAKLIEILDLFIDAGWPQALRLSSRLEEIFR